MTISNLITPSGKWFAMMKCQDAPECVQPARIAAFALHEGHVVALIPDEDTATLRIVTDDECVGIADSNGSRDANWQDIAKSRAEIDVGREDRDLAKNETEVQRVTEEFKNIGGIARLIMQVRDGDTYEYNPKIMHRLYENDVLDPVEGGYRITRFGEAVLKGLRGKTE